MRASPGWKTFTLLLVVAAHAWLGWMLARYRPDGRLEHIQSREGPRADEVLLVLSFDTRVAPKAASALPSPRLRRRTQSAAEAQEDGLASERGGSAAGPMDFDPGRPLDLAPAPLAKEEFAVRGALEHQAPALAYESTRYDKAWISTGNLTHVVARRSMLAGVVLGALGALREPCTEQQRREYDPRCVSDQYQHLEGAR